MTPQERLTIEDRLRQTLSGQTQVGLLDQLGAFSEGALESALAGTPEAIAARSGVDINSPEAARNLFPQTNEFGKLAGSIIPLGALSRGAALGREGLKQLAKQGARIGGLYGAGTGASSVAKQEDGTIEEALMQALLQGGVGAGIGAALPAAFAAAPRISTALQEGLRASADKSRAQALLAGGGTGTAKRTVEKLLPQMRERPVGETYALTREGLQRKAETALEKAGEAFEEVGALEGSTKTAPLLKFLDDLKTSSGAEIEGRPILDTDLNNIELVREKIAQYGDVISDDNLNKIKKSFAKKGYGVANATEGSLKEIQKLASDEIRGILAEKHPDFAKINQEYSFWRGLSDVTEATNLRKRGHSFNTANITAALAGVGGVLSGGTIPAALGTGLALGVGSRYLVKAMQSPGWKLASAKVKDSLAKALAIGEEKQIAAAASKIKGFVPPEIPTGPATATSSAPRITSSGPSLEESLIQNIGTPGEQFY